MWQEILLDRRLSNPEIARALVRSLPLKEDEVVVLDFEQSAVGRVSSRVVVHVVERGGRFPLLLTISVDGDIPDGWDILSCATLFSEVAEVTCVVEQAGEFVAVNGRSIRPVPDAVVDCDS